jgi:uncharacterized lipoprotein YmbA
MRISHAALALCAAFSLNACSSSVKTYYYTLQTDEATAREAAPVRQTSIALTSVSLPEIVDRPQLVLRTGTTQLDISDNHLWGQPLKSEIAHRLAVDLARETGAARVILPGQAGYDDAEIKLAVDILRFDSVPGKDATIEARWSVQRKGAAKSTDGHAVVKEVVSGAGYDALIAAHSQALGQLSREIAAMLKP